MKVSSGQSESGGERRTALRSASSALMPMSRWRSSSVSSVLAFVSISEDLFGFADEVLIAPVSVVVRYLRAFCRLSGLQAQLVDEDGSRRGKVPADGSGGLVYLYRDRSGAAPDVDRQALAHAVKHLFGPLGELVADAQTARLERV